MKACYVASVLIVVIVAACDSSVDRPKRQAYNIVLTGTITSSETGEPLEGAVATMEQFDTSYESWPSDTTGTDGEYRLSFTMYKQADEPLCYDNPEDTGIDDVLWDFLFRYEEVDGDELRKVVKINDVDDSFPQEHVVITCEEPTVRYNVSLP